MAAIDNIDAGTLANDILPNEKRTNPIKAFITGLLSAFNRMHLIYQGYREGGDIYTTGAYAAGTYNLYDQVYYIQTGGVYESLEDSNTADPTDSTKWKKLYDEFLGTEISQHFDGSHIMLTYALNSRYISTFNQYPNVDTSDIYIERVPLNDSMFQVGGDEDNSSAIYLNTCTEFITAEDVVTSEYSMIVWVLNAVWNTIGSSDDVREKSVRNFVDKYIPIGITYSVDNY
jgi:hypothetical protein